jgi:hypothetical protein
MVAEAANGLSGVMPGPFGPSSDCPAGLERPPLLADSD